MLSKEILDCALLSWQDKHYLLPTIGMIKLISLNHIEMTDFLSNQNVPWISEMSWQNLHLPVVTFNLLPPDQNNQYPKIAILHAFFSGALSNTPYFGVLVEKASRRLKIKPEDLTWENEAQRQAKLVFLQEDIQVTLLDLHHLSLEVEKMMNDNKPSFGN